MGLDSSIPPSAYATTPDQQSAARRCIDRHVPDLGERVTVAQMLGLLPYVGRTRTDDRMPGRSVERGAT